MLLHKKPVLSNLPAAKKDCICYGPINYYDRRRHPQVRRRGWLSPHPFSIGIFHLTILTVSTHSPFRSFCGPWQSTRLS
ncbi:hypothetical protein F4823DRAFT_574416 [Ustulina deusta]|nr:hypothetical protein F4823DRAFT_574416 [Ustulina deusta]